MSYELIVNNLKTLNLKEKKIIILGAGFIAREYCKALLSMGITNVTIISRTEKSAQECKSLYDYRCLYGGYLNQSILNSEFFDLVIVALPIHQLKSASEYTIKCGQKNILVEKPASLYSEELEKWSQEIDTEKVRIRVAYNRLLYPNLWKLKDLIADDGGITSCTYTFTEWIHTINFDKEKKDTYERWGISNSLHVISMVHSLIGMPKEFSAFQSGYLLWHPTGSIFVGCGITEFDIPFSYHADWDSAGRWGIEIMTRKNAYRLIPLEDLYRCSKGSVLWNKIDFEKVYPEVKQGIVEEVVIMLNPELEKFIHLVTLEKAALFTKLAEKIFGYSSSSIREQ